MVGLSKSDCRAGAITLAVIGLIILLVCAIACVMPHCQHIAIFAGVVAAFAFMKALACFIALRLSKK